jgi:hypothetical protein
MNMISLPSGVLNDATTHPLARKTRRISASPLSVRKVDQPEM